MREDEKWQVWQKFFNSAVNAKIRTNFSRRDRVGFAQKVEFSRREPPVQYRERKRPDATVNKAIMRITAEN